MWYEIYKLILAMEDFMTTEGQFKRGKILTGEEAEKRLAEMYLTSKSLIQSCVVGLLAKANCTEYDTKVGPGFIQWNNTVRALREFCCGSNWMKFQEDGLEGIITSNGKTKIIPSSGNAATGKPGQIPSNRNTKGVKMIELVEQSCQGSLFYGFPNQKDDVLSEVYVLLYYNTSREMRVELSKPSFISKGIIKAWDERIIMSPFDFNSTNIIPALPTIEDEIDIPIMRIHNEG